MKYNLQEAITILTRTPQVISVLLKDIPTNWATNNEGENTWSPFEIVGHLVHGEKTDWIPRTQIILANKAHKI